MADKRLRDKRINFWLTEAEHSDIAKRAAEYNMSISEFIRTLALNADIHLDLSRVRRASKTETRVIVTSRLSVDFSDEEFNQIELIAKDKELSLTKYLSSLKFISLKELPEEPVNYDETINKFASLLELDE
jgi:hypothetical protein